ncbi:MAG: PAS domain S-box protein [Halorhabdus sp.]
MRVTRWFPAVAAGLGLCVWVVDAAVDTLLFYEGRSFLALLVTDVPAHELYIRSLILVLFVAFGIFTAWGAGRLRSHERDLTLFRRLIDEATDSVFVIDPETGDILDVNETACDVLGYDRETLLAMTVADLNPTFDDPDSFRRFMNSTEGRELSFYETTHERADGTTLPVEVSASTVTVQGRRYRIAIVRDVSERKARERRISHYEQAVESSRDLLTAVDENFRFLFANDAYRTFHGLEADSISGVALDSVIDDAEFERIEPHLEAALAGDRVQFEMVRTHTDRGDRVLDVRYWPLRDADGEIHGVGASLRDVTDRMEMIEDLRRARQRYESLFESIRDAILVADTDRRIVDCNPAFRELFGYPIEEVQGEHVSTLFESVAEFETVEDTLGQHMDDPTVVETFTYQKRSGQVFPGETNVFYRRDQDGEITGLIGLIRDVSERRARTTQIRTVDRVLRHNLNNALTVILGNADRIATEATGDLEACAERIVTQGEQLRETAEKERQITTFLSESSAPIERDAVPIVEAVVEDVRARHPDVDLTVDLPEAAPVLAVRHLDRAIDELLTNAVVHSDRARPSVTITIRTVEGSVEISVADDGPGIPAMERQILTGQRDVKPTHHGRGIGLWLVSLIVQYSDGALTFEENDPRGSVVTMRLLAGDTA